MVLIPWLTSTSPGVLLHSGQPLPCCGRGLCWWGNLDVQCKPGGMVCHALLCATCCDKKKKKKKSKTIPALQIVNLLWGRHTDTRSCSLWGWKEDWLMKARVCSYHGLIIAWSNYKSMERLKKNNPVLLQWWSASRVPLGLEGVPLRGTATGSFIFRRSTGMKYQGWLRCWDLHCHYQADVLSCTESVRAHDKAVTGHKWRWFSSFLVYEENLSKKSDRLLYLSPTQGARIAIWPLQPQGDVLGWSCVLPHISLIFKGNETTQFQCPLVFFSTHLSFHPSVSIPQQTSRNFSSDGEISKMMYSYGYHDTWPLSTLQIRERHQLMSLHSDKLQWELKFICSLESAQHLLSFLLLVGRNVARI